MPSALLTSVLTLASVSVFSFYIFLIFLKNKKERLDLYFSMVWLMVAAMMGLMSIRTFFFAFGYYQADKIIAYFVQVSLVFFVWSFVFFINLETKNKNFSRIFSGLFILLGFVFLFFLFSQGIEGPIASGWGSEFTAPLKANAVLLAGGLLAVIFLLKNFIMIIINKKITDKKVFRKNFLMYLAFIWLLVFGVFEQLGNEGWQVLFFRVSLLISPLIAFFSIEEKEKYY